MIKKVSVVFIYLFVFIISGCTSDTQITPIELSQEESVRFAALLPSQTNYKLYEVNFDTEEYTTLRLICDFYSYGKLISSVETIGFMRNDDIADTGNIVIGLTSNIDSELSISCSASGIINRHSVNLSDYDEFQQEKWGILTSTNIIINSDTDYIIYHAVYSEGAVSSYDEGSFDPEQLLEYPFFYTVRCVFE